MHCDMAAKIMLMYTRSVGMVTLRVSVSIGISVNDIPAMESAIVFGQWPRCLPSVITPVLSQPKYGVLLTS